MGVFQIQSGIPRPGPKQSGGPLEKYPLQQMKVGDFFIVPQSEMFEGDTSKKFRDRVNQAVRTYKQRANQKASVEPDFDEATFEPVDFTVLTLGEPPQDHPDAWQPGDVGVWRDS